MKVAGKSRDQITAALKDASWTDREIEGALQSWTEGPFGIPVPRPRSVVSAAEAFSYGLMFVALAVCAINLSILGMELVDLWFRPAVSSYSNHAHMIRWTLSWLIVFGPLFVWMDRRTARQTRDDPSRRRSAVRRWFASATLFASSIALLIDAGVTVNGLFEGEATAAFILKSLIVAAIAAAILFYFKQDAADQTGS